MTRTRLLWLAVIVVLLLLPFGIRCCTIRPLYFQQVVDLALIYATATASLTLLAGTAGQISLGQGGFMAVGAYVTALLAVQSGWPLAPAVLVAMLAAGIVGVLVGVPALRLRGPYLVMATLAFAGIAYGVVLNWTSVTRGPQGIGGIPSPTPFGIPVRSEFAFYFYLLAALALAIAVVLVTQRSHRGLRMKAVRDDELAAEALGIRPAYEKTAAFGLSAAIAGLAGALLSTFVGYISPDFFTIDQSLLVLTMALVGGIATISGALIGAFGITALAEALRDFSQYQLIAYGLAVLAVVTVIPDGLVGAVRRALIRRQGRRAGRADVLGSSEVGDAA